jgi:hypothetical protein
MREKMNGITWMGAGGGGRQYETSSALELETLPVPFLNSISTLMVHANAHFSSAFLVVMILGSSSSKNLGRKLYWVLRM